MKNCDSRTEFFARTYTAYSSRVLGYIASRINSAEDAENLAQDVWVRLLEYDKSIAEDSILPLLYKISVNLVNDYLRRIYRGREAADEYRNSYCEADWSSVSAIVARDIESLEQSRVECLPQQRRIIYVMSRYEDHSVDDIANALSLSRRTVENHLRMGRSDIRTYMKEAI